MIDMIIFWMFGTMVLSDGNGLDVLMDDGVDDDRWYVYKMGDDDQMYG